MKRIEVEVISEATNATVVLLPNRRFPGIVVQGDSLAILADTARRALEALSAGQAEEASDELLEVCELLNGYREEYEKTLRTAGLELPYVASRGQSES